jgi:hypothetical protein
VSERVDPSALRWLIGVELRNYRNQAGVTTAVAAKAIGCSAGKVTHLETGRNQQRPDEVEGLLRYYGAPASAVERLSSLAGRADQRAWWAPWTDVVPDWLATFVGLEGLASAVSTYEPILVPGLLQTEGYARAVTYATPRVRGDHAERFVALRLARAARLTGDDLLLLHAVIGEAALRLDIGDPEIMRSQCRHLLALSERPNVTIQVLRPEDGLHRGVTGAFHVLEFSDVRPIAYVEIQDGALYVQDTAQVENYLASARNLASVALDPDDTCKLLTERAA